MLMTILVAVVSFILGAATVVAVAVVKMRDVETKWMSRGTDERVD